MKQDASFFEGKEPRLIYIAKKLKDALQLESIFDAAGLDYGVETDEYSGGRSLPQDAGGRVLLRPARSRRSCVRAHAPERL